LTDHFDSCIYLDSDIYVTHAFTRIWERCDGFSFAFTPHHLAPPPYLSYTSDILVAHFGFLNSGFYVCTRSAECFYYLKWLQDQLVKCGFCNSVNGMFGDQKLIPQLLQFMPESVLILTDPCLNIAFWNAHERNVASRNGSYTIDDEPVIFFHLSGFDYRDLSRICNYLPFHVNNAIGLMAPWLLDVTYEYQRLVSGVKDYSMIYQCHYGQYNRITLTRAMRWLLYQKKHLDPLDLDVLSLQFMESLKSIKRSVRKALYKN
jgi:hypothetical protein